MSKVYLALFLMGFWIFLPLPLMLLNVGNYDFLREEDLVLNTNEQEVPNLTNFLGSMGSYIKIYFIILVFGIVGAPVIINLFLLFLKGGTVIYLLFMLRGN